MRIILASKSPRRREILELLGVKFDIETADTDETCDIKEPGTLVETLAKRKGMAVVEKVLKKEGCDKDVLFISCDTLVYADGEFLGKPKDVDDARRMISMLSGNTHEVYSGICLYLNGKCVTAHQSTKVEFASMTPSEIETYISTDEPYDKAGGYAVQGKAALYIKGIIGDYFNVVGLPVQLLYSLLRDEFEITV